jgi:prepilin-type N-terminal cleavage/methylation domain-containing protein
MRTSGFTLIEMLIALALIGAVASIGMFASFALYRKSGAQNERDAVVMLLAHARSGSMDNLYGATHGFCLDSSAGEYRVFRAPYGPGMLEASEAHESAVTVAGIPECGSGNEIVFEQLSGATVPTAITMSEGGETYQIALNEAGTIVW